MPEILTRAKIYEGTTEISCVAQKTTHWIDISGRGRLKILIANFDDGTIQPILRIDEFEQITLPSVDTLNTNNVESDNGFYWAHDVTGSEEGFTLNDIPFQKRLQISFYNTSSSTIASQFYLMILEVEVGTAIEVIGKKNPFKND